MSLECPHNLPGAPKLMHYIENVFAKVWFYDNIVITEVEQGAKINYKNTFDLIVKGINYIDYQPWVYISNRIYNYEVDVKFYKYLNFVPYLKGMAIVHPKGMESNTEVPLNSIIKKEIAFFEDLSSAYLWAQELLKKSKQ